MNRPFRKARNLLIGQRTRTRAHSWRHYSSEAQPSTAFFYILGQLTGRPTKLKDRFFDSPPRHRAVALPAGPNDEADLCVMKQFLKNLSFKFQGTFAGNGKTRVFYIDHHVQMKHRDWERVLREWERVRVRSPMSKYSDFRKGRFIK